jgi:tRNA 2-thiouridine synthesizing protein A
VAGTGDDVAGADAVVVDARGQRCPLPINALARRARELPAGSVVVLLATEPAARHDVPAWARLRGHVPIGEEALPGGDGWRLAVRLAGG